MTEALSAPNTSGCTSASASELLILSSSAISMLGAAISPSSLPLSNTRTCITEGKENPSAAATDGLCTTTPATMDLLALRCLARACTMDTRTHIAQGLPLIIRPEVVSLRTATEVGDGGVSSQPSRGVNGIVGDAGNKISVLPAASSSLGQEQQKGSNGEKHSAAAAFHTDYSNVEISEKDDEASLFLGPQQGESVVAGAQHLKLKSVKMVAFPRLPKLRHRFNDAPSFSGQRKENNDEKEESSFLQQQEREQQQQQQTKNSNEKGQRKSQKTISDEQLASVYSPVQWVADPELRQFLVDDEEKAQRRFLAWRRSPHVDPYASSTFFGMTQKAEEKEEEDEEVVHLHLDLRDFFCAFEAAVSSSARSSYTAWQLPPEFLYKYSNLHTVELPSSFPSNCLPKRLPNRWFGACEKLVHVDLSSLRSLGLRSVGDGFLACCRVLRTVDLTGLTGVMQVGDDFMSGCKLLESIDLTPLASVVSIGRSFLASCPKIRRVSVAPLSNLLMIPDNFLKGCSSLMDLDLTPFQHCELIGDNFLAGCGSLRDLDLSPLRSVNCVGAFFLGYTSQLCTDPYKILQLSSFGHCRVIGEGFLCRCGAREITLSSLMCTQMIGGAFCYMCTTIVEIDLSWCARRTSIPDRFLVGCRSLRVVKGMNGLSQVVDIGDDFLAECEALERLDCTPLVELKKIGSGFLRECSSLRELYFPPLATRTISSPQQHRQGLSRSQFSAQGATTVLKKRCEPAYFDDERSLVLGEHQEATTTTRPPPEDRSSRYTEDSYGVESLESYAEMPPQVGTTTTATATGSNNNNNNIYDYDDDGFPFSSSSAPGVAGRSQAQATEGQPSTSSSSSRISDIGMDFLAQCTRLRWVTNDDVLEVSNPPPKGFLRQCPALRNQFIHLVPVPNSQKPFKSYAWKKPS